MTHYILVKLEADNVDAVILTLDAALDGDDIHKSIGRALVCDIRNVDVLDTLDRADLMPSRTETRQKPLKDLIGAVQSEGVLNALTGIAGKLVG